MICNFDKVKIVVTVPQKYGEQVRQAACQAGAGVIGNYTCCTFSVRGQGTFVPNAQAKPFLGRQNCRQKVKEMQLEMVCDNQLVKNVVAAIRSHHPYEEPVIDIVPLLDETCFCFSTKS